MIVFLYHREHQKVQLNSWLYSTFKEFSNDSSHAQIQVKMKKLWPQQVGEEKQASKHKLCSDISRLCRDKANNKAKKFVTTNPDYIATKLEDKLCCDKVLLCRDKTKDKLKTNFVATKSEDQLYSDKVLLCRDKVIRKTLSQQSFTMLRHCTRPLEC